METPQPTTRSDIFSQCREIVQSNRRVVNILTAFFLLPTAAAAALYTTLRSLSPSVHIFSTVIISVTYLIVTPCALGSISYAALLSRAGKNPSVSAAVKSLSSSFFPLLATLVTAQSAIALAAVGYIFILSSASLVVFMISTAVLVPLLTYVEVNWTLAYPVAIFESTRGLAALRRSSVLVRGNGWLVLSVNLTFWPIYGVIFWTIGTSSGLSVFFDGTIGARTRTYWWLQLIGQVLLILSSVFLFYCFRGGNIVANTMLYICCRNTHIDGAGEDFLSDYFSLPVNGQRVASLT